MNNSKFRFLIIIFLATFVCFALVIIIQGKSISNLKKVNANLNSKFEESKKDVSNKDSTSGDNQNSKYSSIEDLEEKDYQEFIKQELIPKIDEQDLTKICNASSTFSMYICELELEYHEDDGDIYFDKIDEISEKKYIDSFEDISQIDIEYENIAFMVSSTTKKSAIILWNAGVKGGSRIKKPWIEVLNYDGYETMPSAGVITGGMMYIFMDMKKGDKINLKLSEGLAEQLKINDSIIKINIK